MRDNNHGSGHDPFEHRRRATSGSSREPTNGRNGHRPSGMTTRSVPFDEIGEPVDLVAVQADDELINALAAGMTVSSPGLAGYDADDRVAAILAAWKADVDAEPIPELVDGDTAVATVLAARQPARRRLRLVPMAAAAAFLVLVGGGLSVGSYDAGPDDTLWAVSKVLYSERAQSVEAAVRVEQRITNAKKALVAGEPVIAAQELAQARTDLAAVRPEEGATELAQVQDFLVAKAAETPPGTPTDPGAPLATQPSRPVPAGAAIQQPATPDSTAPWRPAPGTESPPPVTTTSVAPAQGTAPSQGHPGSGRPPSSQVGPQDQATVAPAPATRPGPRPTSSPNPNPNPNPSANPTSAPPPPPSQPPTSGANGSGTAVPTSPPAPGGPVPGDTTTTPGQSMGEAPSSSQDAGGSTGATAAGSGTSAPAGTTS